MTDRTDPIALIVVDVQCGFEAPMWGRRNNRSCEENIAALVTVWRERDWPTVFVRHDSRTPAAPLAPGQPGNDFKSILDGKPDLLVAKEVNSAFYGQPDLHEWLTARRIRGVAICGITTNHCCETAARMAGNLGYETWFILDATHTFDRRDLAGEWVSADELTRVTATNLHGEFATVLQTAEVVARISGDRATTTAPQPQPGDQRPSILMISGSGRAGSTNTAVVNTAAQLAPPEVRPDTFDGLGELPLFNPDADLEGAEVDHRVALLRRQVARGDAVLICTPEYAGALPAALKNLLEWTIGDGGLYAKPVAWINAAGPGAPTGAADAHASLRKVLQYAGADIIEQASVRIPVSRSDLGTDGLIESVDIRREVAAAVERLARLIGPGSRTKP